jgi:hypothetical protein
VLDPRIIPAEKYIALTPNDSTNLTPTRGLYVGVSGDVKVISIDGNTVTFIGLAAGEIHWISCTRVFATDTDATDIVAIY